ncbi:uncharacterized protein K452DRAFT_229445 [Aplosporella prunicola CBS 121167]|uniref:DUF1748-domain-containing protein n=1 Tax=Aplosporella prunicola CBS 121167 TaxID=1176127 RepID=A0A6A6BBW1_9PEZI|nr:uncharacterized protein K452DRAFT_229445 [Aplosporella prunicola CBS 121167]KAF2140853.1 hypothetical protein K452DRAFT_229445 [Aplosporella prunicola CBS 121167]
MVVRRSTATLINAALSLTTLAQFGRLTHYAFDAVLFSAFLAGVKRSTGLTPSLKSETISESDNVKKWVDNYLWVGEVVMDQGVALMSSSGYFERKR